MLAGTIAGRKLLDDDQPNEGAYFLELNDDGRVSLSIPFMS